MKTLGKICAIIYSIMFYFIITIAFVSIFALKFVNNNFYIKAFKNIDFNKIIVNEYNETLEDAIISDLEENGIDKEDAKKILNSSEFKEFMGNIVGNYVNYILTDNKTDIVSKSDIRKIINKIEDITGNKIEVDEDEIVNAINEIKENSEVSKEVVMTISYFKGNTIYIWLTIIIIISYLLVSLFTNSFYKPLNYLSIPIMLSGITFVITRFASVILFNIMNISPNISNSMNEIMSYILNPLLYIGIILIIASVLMIIIYNLIKNKKGNFTV